MSIVYGKKGQYQEAIKWHNEALKIRSIAHNENLNHPDIATSYNNLGVVYFKNGEYKQAIEYYDKALSIRLKAYEANPNHPDLAQSYDNLALVYGHNNIRQYGQAIQSLKNALKIYEVIYKGNQNNPKIAHNYNDLAMNYGQKGEYKQADQYFKKALAIYKIAYKEKINHPDISRVLDNQKVNDEFIKIEDRVKTAFKKAKLPNKCNDAEIEIDISNINKEYLKMYFIHDLKINSENLTFAGNFCSISFSIKAIKIMCEKLASENISIAEQEAKIESNAQNENSRILVTNHDSLLANQHGKKYYLEGNYQKAVEEFTKALSLPNMQNNITLLYNLARSYHQNENLDQAMNYYSKVLELNPGHSKVLNYIKELMELAQLPDTLEIYLSGEDHF